MEFFESILSTLMLYSVPALIFVVFFTFVRWRIYEKAGQPGWACLIPVYSLVVLLRIVKKPTWWIILIFFVPIVNIIILIKIIHQLSKKFGYGVGFTLGLIFLGFIFFPILAFGSAKYVDGNETEEQLSSLKTA